VNRIKKDYETLMKKLYEVPGTAEYMNSKEVKEELEAYKKRKEAYLKEQKN